MSSQTTAACETAMCRGHIVMDVVNGLGTSPEGNEQQLIVKSETCQKQQVNSSPSPEAERTGRIQPTYKFTKENDGQLSPCCTNTTHSRKISMIRAVEPRSCSLLYVELLKQL